jgi:hypothetical protein
MATSTMTEAPAGSVFAGFSDDDLFEMLAHGLREAVTRATTLADRAEATNADGATVKQALAFAANLHDVLPVWGSGRLREVFHDGSDVVQRIRGERG